MGTRADFYVGVGESAEWIGSIGWDGYPEEDTLHDIFRSTDEETFRQRVKALLADRDDGTTPEMGWPWPWDDSGTTDFAYCWDDRTEKVVAARFGDGWFDPFTKPDSDGDYHGLTTVQFPDMTERQNVAMDHRSGLMFMNSAGPPPVGAVTKTAIADAMTVGIALSLYQFNVSAYERAKAIHDHFGGNCYDMEDLMRMVDEPSAITSLPYPSAVVYVRNALTRYGHEAARRREPQYH